MEVMSSSSKLNPQAAAFVPGACRAVEDDSPEWWSMVESSAEFRDCCLRECFHAKEKEMKGPKSSGWELLGRGAEKWHAASGRSVGPKHSDKASKIVNMRVGPRTIQQPR